ncbi:MAG: ABC transporter substrate-binding protein [Planctomycetes bacterium]|nr:ABC transporter substrate-binding protein [Planctomycetota bacterium]
MNLRWLLLLLVVAATALPWALVDAQPAPPPVPVPVPVPAQPAPAPIAEVTTLRLPLEDGWTLDPHFARTPASLQLCAAIYDGLYTYATGPKPEIKPALAEALPVISADGLTWTIKLRKDVRFHNSAAVFGEAKSRNLVASDVVHSLKRLSAAGPDESMYWLIKGIIKGLDDYGDAVGAEDGARSDGQPVAGLAAPDDHTVVLKLTRPFGALLTVLAHPCTSIVPREAMDTYGGALMVRAVGTGPFRLHAVGESRLIVLKRFDGHWGPKPAYERITLTAQDSPIAAFKSVAEGNLARCDILNGESLRFLTPGGKPGPLLKKAGLEPRWSDNEGMYFMAFNMEDALWGALDDDGRLLRKAVSQAFDRTAFQIASGFSDPWGRPAVECMPPGTEYDDLAQAHALGGTDGKAAKATLDASRYKGGKNPDTGEALMLSVVVQNNNGLHRALSNTLKTSLQPLGIEVAVRTVRADYRATIRKDDGGAFFAGWFMDSPDSQNFLQLLYGPNAGITDEFANPSRYKNPDFDTLYQEFEALLPVPANEKRRRELADSMLKLVQQDRPIVPLFVRREAELRSDKVIWQEMPRVTYTEFRHIQPPKTE